METLDFCKKHNACREGVEFASKFQTLAEVWDACPRADWMIWMLQKADKTGGLERTLRIFACDCAELANPTDPRSLAAIAVARRYADGLATADELYSAATAADDAYAAAAATAANAAYAAYATTATDASYAAASDSAAATTAEASYAAATAADASYAAASDAAYAEADADAAYARASAATRKTHAERLRAAIPNPFTKAGQESP